MGYRRVVVISFCRQLLQAFINNKINLTDSNDPVSMGRYACMFLVTTVVSYHGYRQLLELQKLKRRAKKVVDTKASKGRKIRSVFNLLPAACT